MPASEARINANRLNCLKSSGPKTQAGKDRSRANAVKHGLCSEVVLVDQDAEALREVAGDISLTPTSPRGLDGWAAGQVALNSVRIERCQEMERAIRQRIVTRAEVTWDEDRRLEATRLGATLARRPEEVVGLLRETYHGCEWLLARWAMLAHSADVQKGWTPEQERLAFDLLGTPVEFRDGKRLGVELDFHGQPVAETRDEAAIARRMIAELLARREQLRPLDEANRERAEADLAHETDPEIRRLRRYETELQRRLQWSLALVEKLTTDRSSPSTPEPGPPNEPKARPIRTRPTPEVGIPNPAPTTRSASRAEKKRRRAEARRESKLRKLENRRS